MCTVDIPFLESKLLSAISALNKMTEEQIDDKARSIKIELTDKIVSRIIARNFDPDKR